MASVADICNMGLSHVGNRGGVISITPPDGSIEADLCARFFSVALGRALEFEDWVFARTRATLATLATNPSTVWAYAYAKPSNCLMPRRILTDNAANFEDDSESFEFEGDTIFTNKASAVLVFTQVIIDPTKYTPAFIDTLAYMLGSYLAGPIIRGAAGADAGAALRKAAAAAAKEGVGLNANRGDRDQNFVPGQVASRSGAALNPANYGPATGSAAADDYSYYGTSGYVVQ